MRTVIKHVYGPARISPSLFTLAQFGGRSDADRRRCLAAGTVCARAEFLGDYREAGMKTDRTFKEEAYEIWQNYQTKQPWQP